MHILLQSRIDSNNNPAGDTVHLLSIAKELKKINQNVSISYDLRPNVSRYDIIHIFNISKPYEAYIQFRNAKKYNKKVVLMPIYQNYDKWNRKGTSGFSGLIFKILPSTNTQEFVKNLGRGILDNRSRATIPIQLTNSYKNLQKYLLTHADGIMFTSFAEKKSIEKTFQYKFKTYTITPSGIDKSFGDVNPNLFTNKYHLSNFLLCVANFNSRKNQLNLLRALRNTNYSIVLIGNIIKTHLKYFNILKNEIEKYHKNVYILSDLDRKYVRSAFSAAKIHILPSWSENAPLVNLEAIVSNCNVVTTKNSYMNDILGKNVWYCNPENLISIKNAVKNAYCAKFSHEYKNYILENFTWDKITQETYKFYQNIIDV